MRGVGGRSGFRFFGLGFGLGLGLRVEGLGFKYLRYRVSGLAYRIRF